MSESEEDFAAMFEASIKTRRFTVATNLLADAFNARDNFRIMLRVGDLSPRSSWLI